MTFKLTADAVKAKAANGVDFEGRTIIVRLASEPREATQGSSYGQGSYGSYGKPSYGQGYSAPQATTSGTTAFVGNLSYQTTKETLAKYFAGCGKVVEIRIPLNEEGKPRGFAHVEFDSEEAVKKAIALSGNDLDGRSIKVDFSQSKQGGGFGRRRYGGEFRRRSYGGYRRGRGESSYE